MKPAGNFTRVPMDLDQAGLAQGTVHIIDERCKQCNYCIAYCPVEVLEYSTRINSRGYHFPVVAEGKEAACVLCKFCDLICPEFAIFTTDANDSGAETD